MVSHKVGAVAEQAEKEKAEKYAALEDFKPLPVVIETSGHWGRTALELTKQLGNQRAGAGPRLANNQYL